MSLGGSAGDAAVLTIDRLLGADQGWIDVARKTLTGVVSTFLDREMSGAFSGDTHRLPVGDDPFEWPLVWKSVAVPLNDLLADLALGRETAESLDALLTVFDEHGLVTVHGKDDPADPSPRWAETDARQRTAALGAAHSEHRSGGFGALLIHVLASSDARRRHHTSVSMPVLLHNVANDRRGRAAGEIGTLTLTTWRGGPPGLHPDPRVMTFSSLDEEARRALQEAMLGSMHAARGVCVTWALRDADEAPVRRLEGESLGAALALLLRELSPRQGVGAAIWHLRPRRLRSDWTVTAGLRDRQLTRVFHYESKLEAVAALSKPLHVAIAPRADPSTGPGADPVLVTGKRLGIDIRVLETLEALSTATRTLNRRFVAGVLGVIVVCAAFGGVVVKAKQAVDAAQRAADKRSAATELMQQSRSLLDKDPRLAALTALAADDLDSSIRTEQLISDVLAANNAAIGSAQVSSTYVADVEVSHNTLLVLDGDERVTAWSLPDFRELGTVVESGARGLAGAGPGDAVILVDADLRVYHTADGYLPREVDVIETGLAPEGVVFGPYITDVMGGGVMVVDEGLNGVYYDNGLRSPYQFSVADDSVIEPDPRQASVTVEAATAGVLGHGYPPDGVSEVGGIAIATSTRQVIDLAVEKHYSGPPRPHVIVRSVMPAVAAKAAIRNLSPGPNATILLGTDRGVQQWDPATYETVEFPYGGWSEQVDDIYYDYGMVVVMGKQRLGFFDEPIDDRPRETPTIVELGGSVFTAVASGDIWTDDVRFIRYIAGREDGTIGVFDPTDSRFGPGTLEGSNVQAFTPTGHLIRTVGVSPQRSGYLRTEAIPDESPDREFEQPAYDPYEQTYVLPETNGLRPYVNDASASARWVVAAGRRADGMGVWWAWPLAGGEYAEPREIPFGYGEAGDDPVPDIVSDIAFVDDDRQIVALNGAKGELGFWTVEDWEQVGSVSFEVPTDFDTSGATRLVVSADGHVVAVRDSETTVKIIDIASHEVTRTIELPDGSITDVALSPDGSRLAVVDHLKTVRLLDLANEPGTVLLSHEQPSVVNALAFDPQGTRLAVGMGTASTVEILSAATLDPQGPPWAANDGYRVVDLAWSPDGAFLSVGTMQHEGSHPVNGDTHILDPTMLTWRQQLCQMATSNFTTVEWRDLSGSDLPVPDLCDWGAELAQESPTDAVLSDPSDSGDLTRADLMAAAPVPELCGHEAGSLVLGHLPTRTPLTGDVYLGDTVFGDLTGDGEADAVADIECNAGGVGWPSTIAAYTRADDGTVALLGTISAADTAIVGPKGSERPVVVAVDVEEGRMTADIIANTDGDPACCGTLPIHVELSVGRGGLQVVSADRRYDLVVVNKLVDGITTAVATGIEFDDVTDTPDAVIVAITKMTETYVGVAVRDCLDPGDLPNDLADRAASVPSVDGTLRYCSVVAAPGEDVDPLLLRLVEQDDDSWRIVDQIR